MFSSKSELQKRTPENGTDRENFLSLLVDEYLQSTSYEAKCQVLANLANFAYDPINYGFIRDVGVLDIFLHVLKNETDENLLHFAVAGICNLCLDPENAQYIVKNSGLNAIIQLLQKNNTEIIADTITTLLYLYNKETHSEISSTKVIQTVSGLQNSQDKRLANLATLFLQDVCKSSSTV